MGRDFTEAGRILDRLTAQKKWIRSSRAKLTVERKLQLLIYMQRSANEIRRGCGRVERPVWRLLASD